jgi:hypothetical protein
MTAPTLILIGEADEASPAEECREMVAHARPEGSPITLTVYPGVHHNFDVAALAPGIRHFGHWLEYNEPAAKDAEEKVHAFLAAHRAGHLPASRPQGDERTAFCRGSRHAVLTIIELPKNTIYSCRHRHFERGWELSL